MAGTLKSDEERQKRIIMVGEYVKETGQSTRKTAEHFTKTYFNISNATVSNYCVRYMKLRPDEVDELRGKINENTPKKIDDSIIAKRVLENAKLFLSGLTVSQIAEFNHQDFWSVYRDLTKRLKLLDREIYEEVALALAENSSRNLRNAK